MRNWCPSLSGEKGQSVTSCCDVNVLRIRTSKDADPEERHSHCVCCLVLPFPVSCAAPALSSDWPPPAAGSASPSQLNAAVG